MNMLAERDQETRQELVDRIVAVQEAVIELVMDPRLPDRFLELAVRFSEACGQAVEKLRRHTQE